MNNCALCGQAVTIEEKEEKYLPEQFKKSRSEMTEEEKVLYVKIFGGSVRKVSDVPAYLELP